MYQGNGNGALPEVVKELVRIRGWAFGKDIMVEKGKLNPTWSWVW